MVKVWVLLFVLMGSKENTQSIDVDAGVFQSKELCEQVKGIMEPDLKKDFKVVQLLCTERQVYQDKKK